MKLPAEADVRRLLNMLNDTTKRAESDQVTSKRAEKRVRHTFALSFSLSPAELT
jgi:hypothetical protein